MAAAGLLYCCSTGRWLRWCQSIVLAASRNEQWVVDSGQRLSFSAWIHPTACLLFFSPPVLPCRSTSAIVISSIISDHQAGLSAWAYPLLMLLASITYSHCCGRASRCNPHRPCRTIYLPSRTLPSTHMLGLGAASIIWWPLRCCVIMSTMLAKWCSTVLSCRQSTAPAARSYRWINLRLLISISGYYRLRAAQPDCQRVAASPISIWWALPVSRNLTPGHARLYLPAQSISRSGFIVGLLRRACRCGWSALALYHLLVGDWSWSGARQRPSTWYLAWRAGIPGPSRH